MALRPIPRKILTHSAVLKKPLEPNKYGSVEYESIALGKIHIQRVHDIVKSKDNTETKLSGILFWDAQLSTPQNLDWDALSAVVKDSSRALKAEYEQREYTVYSIDFLPDDRGNLHHIELFLM